METRLYWVTPYGRPEYAVYSTGIHSAGQKAFPGHDGMPEMFGDPLRAEFYSMSGKYLGSVEEGENHND
jgi:hypothetical protein